MKNLCSFFCNNENCVKCNLILLRNICIIQISKHQNNINAVKLKIEEHKNVLK